MYCIGDWRRCISRWDCVKERNQSGVCHLCHGKNGGDMGKGLQGVQAREVAPRRPVHERVSLQVHRLQWRTSALPRERFCLLSDEIRCCVYNIPLPCQGGGKSSSWAEACIDNVHEAWVEGESDPAPWVWAPEVPENQKLSA